MWNTQNMCPSHSSIQTWGEGGKKHLSPWAVYTCMSNLEEIILSFPFLSVPYLSPWAVYTCMCFVTQKGLTHRQTRAAKGVIF